MFNSYMVMDKIFFYGINEINKRMISVLNKELSGFVYFKC